MDSALRMSAYGRARRVWTGLGPTVSRVRCADSCPTELTCGVFDATCPGSERLNGYGTGCVCVIQGISQPEQERDNVAKWRSLIKREEQEMAGKVGSKEPDTRVQLQLVNSETTIVVSDKFHQPKWTEWNKYTTKIPISYQLTLLTLQYFIRVWWRTCVIVNRVTIPR